MAYRKIFGFSKHESVKVFICGMGRLNFKHMLVLSGIKFFKQLCASSNIVLKTLCSMHVITSSLTSLCYDFDVTLDMSYGAIRRNVFSHFHKECNMF